MGDWYSSPDPFAVYDVLVEECGADESDRERVAFARHWPECREYRFIGNLGFGGKVWWNARRCYVTCYPEDESPHRREHMDRANARLAALITPAPVSPAPDREGTA